MAEKARVLSETQLEERLSRPTALSVEAMCSLGGDLLVLGAGGKMGPSLLRLARRSADAAGAAAGIAAASRFSTPGLADALRREGIEIHAGDLLDEGFRRTLPDAPNVLFMMGHKFSASDLPGTYWMMNVHVPGLLAEQFRRSRIVCFSSGNVYPFTRTGSPAPKEDAPIAPVGEYAWSVAGRERMLEYTSARHGTPVGLLRLNYAAECRYGVLVDLEEKIAAGRPIDLSVPELNFVWQGYANAVALRAFSLARSPAEILNVTGTERHRVRDLAMGLGRRLGVEPRFAGPEGDSSLVSDAARCRDLFGPPDVEAEELMDLVASWLQSGGRTLGKATKFHVRDGKY
ncbi:MAG: NAD(P)-dependent oxidoreductase [Planctomycetia bacterium]|nr:NAD(P)-dependent oxidoreductase [Planctomycetia bacterium]